MKTAASHSTFKNEIYHFWKENILTEELKKNKSMLNFLNKNLPENLIGET